MKRAVQTLTPFAFEGDFKQKPPADPEQLSLSTADLAALLAETREATAALVRDETLSGEAERLARASEKLLEALGLIVNLAQHLETAALDEHDRSTALENVRKLAQSLVHGQGDLFTETPVRSRVGNHSE